MYHKRFVELQNHPKELAKIIVFNNKLYEKIPDN